MRISVFLPLLLPLLAAVSARWLAARLDPKIATWTFTAAAVGLAAAGGFALAALAATGVGQIPLLAWAGEWSVQVLRRNAPASLAIAPVACVLLAAALAATGRALLRRSAALLDAARTARRLPVTGSVDHVVVLDGAVPDAYAVPGVPGRIVVSTAMLDALDERERRVLLAHERAHLAGRHHVFVALAHVAAASNPLLRPVAAAVRYSTERWADEQAARTVGDRRLVARTIGKAALLGRHDHAAPAATLPIAGLAKDLSARPRRLGPIPRRVAALLVAPHRYRRALAVVVMAVLVLATLSSVDTALDLHTLFELAETP